MSDFEYCLHSDHSNLFATSSDNLVQIWTMQTHESYEKHVRHIGLFHLAQTTALFEIEA